MSKTKEDIINWFLENFEDPAEHTPYDSKEGGYIYILGGPYDAREEIENNFTEVSSEIIDETIKELEYISLDWARIPNEEDIHDYLNELNSNYYYDFQQSIEKNIKLINFSFSEKIEISDVGIIENKNIDIQTVLYSIVYANIITLLETYLYEFFANHTLSSDKLLKQFIRTTKEFQNEKISFSEIYQEYNNIDKKAKKYLAEFIWHNLAKVEKLYKNTFNINLQNHTKNIYGEIAIRHDIVHRNSKNKDGKEIKISKEMIKLLISKINILIDFIENEFKEKETNKCQK